MVRLASAFLLVLLLVTGPVVSQGRAALSSASGMLAPPFLLRDLQGNHHRLVDYSGKVLIVNFWASWCAPCREELPALNEVWQQLKGQPVAMLAVNVSDDRESIEAFLQDHPIEFQVLLDSLGHLSRRWQVSGLPTTYLLDPYGRFAHRLVGKRDWERADLLQLVRDLTEPD